MKPEEEKAIATELIREVRMVIKRELAEAKRESRQVKNPGLMIYLSSLPPLSLDEITEEFDEETCEKARPVYDLSSYGGRTPEQIVIERERWFNLREETKQVIELIVDCPADVLDEITKGGRLTKKAIAQYLRRQWGERLIVSQVMEEIKNYVREVEYDKGC